MMIALDCKWWRPSTWDDCVNEHLDRAINATFGEFFELIFNAIGEMVAAAVGAVIKAVATLWVYIPTIHPVSLSGRPIETLAFLRGPVWWLVATLAGVSLVIGGMRIVWQQRGEPLREMFSSLLTLIIASTAGVAAIGLLSRAGDEIAEGFLNRAVERSGVPFAENMAALIANPLGIQALPVVILLGFAAVVVSFIQIVVMIVRNGMLIMLAAVLPLSAALTNTEMGQAWFRRICAWSIAFLAYKPLAAMIYAGAITLGGDRGDLVKIATGLTMMVLSVITLPALLRLVSPPGGGST